MKKLMIAILLMASVASAPNQAKANDVLFPVTLGLYFATSTVGFVICMEDSRNTTAECVFLALLTTAITLDAYDKEAAQQASDDAAAFLAGVAQPSAILNQVFADMRSELNAKSPANHTDEELAYAVMQMADAMLAQK